MRITLILKRVNGVKSYQTQQKRMLLDFLKENSQTPLSIEQIAAGLTGENAPGKSTVYRLINRLVEEGAVRRFAKGNSRHFVYQLLDCRDCADHMHCRCVSCGKLFHMNHQLSKDMERLLAAGGFSLDTGKTTLLGTCKGCTQKVSL